MASPSPPAAELAAAISCHLEQREHRRPRLDGLIDELADLSDRLAEAKEHLSTLRELYGDAERIVVEHGGGTGTGTGHRPPKLSWSREKWLHHPTQEVVDNSDPRVPQTVDASTKQRDWMLIGSQANIEGGYYRRDLDLGTARAAQPTFTATWHTNNGLVVTLARGSGEKVYKACVWHYQANYRA